jgi:tetratricopeptide (TPR) repeat protein
MKRKFEELRENLDEFVQQTDYCVLFVGCVSAEVPYVTQYLASLDQVHAHAYFLPFTHAFETPEQYVQLLFESLQAQLAEAAASRAEDGLEPLPTPPVALSDRALAPSSRLRGILEYLPSLLPNPREQAVVVGLLPLECQDIQGYSRLLAASVPLLEAPEWLKSLRLVIYDDRSAHSLARSAAAAGAKTTLSFDVDFSTPALTDALSRETADPATPLPQRMAYLLQLAALDYSHRRYTDAIEKYGVLYRYYEEPAQPMMQAICLLGVGDAVIALGQLEQGKSMLQSGLALCVEHKLLAPMLNLLLSITDVSTQLEQHEDAESYAQSGTQVAGELLNPFTYADFLERKADAQLAQGKHTEALASYEQCRQTAQRYEYFHRWKAVLRKLQDLYGQLGDEQQRRGSEQELRRVAELERGSGSSGKQPTPRSAEAAPV